MVRNKLFSLCAVVMVVVLCLSSCRKSKPEYVHAIPSDATLILSIDLKALAVKSGMEKNEIAKQKWAEALKERVNSPAGEQVTSLIKNPSQSGISVEDKIYLFALKADGAFSLVAKVTDQEKLKETFEILAKEQACSFPEKVNGYYQTVLDGEAVCAFNETTFLLVSPERNGLEAVKEEIATYMAQKPAQSILSNNGFNQLNEKKSDIGWFVTMETLPEIYTFQLRRSLSDEMELKDIQLLGTLNFEKGKIAMTLENFSDHKQMKEARKRIEEIHSKSASGFMKYFPFSSLMYIGTNIHGEKLLKVSDKFASRLRETSKQSGWDFSAMLSSVQGNMAFGLTSLEQGVGSFLTCVEVKDNTILKELSAKLGGKKIGEKQYAMTMYGMHVTYGMEGKTFYIASGDKPFISLPEIKPSLEESPWRSVAKRSYGYFGLNVSALMASSLPSSLGIYGEQASRMQTVLSQIEYVEAYAASTSQANINIIMTNKDENALKVFVDLGGKLSGAF